MSPSFLVVATDPVIESLVGELVGFAGHQPKYLSHDETVSGVIRLRPPSGVLLDASDREHEVDAATRVAREHDVVVVYFASAMSNGELRSFAERRRVPWFALPNGPKLLAHVLSEAMASERVSEPRTEPDRAVSRSWSDDWASPERRMDDSSRAYNAALVTTRRAQLLVTHAKLVREENLLLRGENKQLLAEASMSHRAMRDAVRQYATSLRASGMSATEAERTVRRLLFESAVTVSDEHTATDVTREALDCVAEVYAA
jgi:hypothetical protein